MRVFYNRDGITLFQRDCLDVLPRLRRVDHVITDPPYSEHTHAKQWNAWALTERGDKRWHSAYHGLGFAAVDASTRDCVARETARISVRWCLTFCDLESIGEWRSAYTTYGLEYVRTCVWDKVDGAPQFTGDRPASGAEAIVVVHPTGKKRWNGGGRRSVFTYRINGERGGKPHPTTKPLPLLLELVSLFTDPGDLVLDPFAGSGTTGVACKMLGRRFIGIEIDPGFARMAAARLDSTPEPLPGFVAEMARQEALL